MSCLEEMEVVRVEIPRRGTYAFDPNKIDLNIGDYCITEDTDSNLAIGQVVGKLKIQKRKFQRSLRKILRKANEEDKRNFEVNARLEVEARVICRKKIKDRGLPMKLVSARFSQEGKKITFYFTAEKRIDFRELVKDLAYIFKRRIELRQIGVRDETRICSGLGCCGRQLCCSGFLNLRKYGRMTIKMAKEQDMTLTPSKISGVCGKLLCCLQYENEWYHEIREEMPQIGGIINTDSTSGKVEEVDIFSGIIKIRDNNDKILEVRFEDLRKTVKNPRKKR